MILSKNYIVFSKIIGLIFALSILLFQVEDSYSTLIFVLIMLTIGIPHGSVDHLIAFINPKSRRFKSKLSFFTIYLSLISVNILWWVFSPYLGLFTFLVVSCYHFGEAQVIGFNDTKNKLLNFVLGANILLSLFLNNIFELQIILNDFTLFSSIDLTPYDKTFFLLISAKTNPHLYLPGSIDMNLGIQNYKLLIFNSTIIGSAVLLSFKDTTSNKYLLF